MFDMFYFPPSPPLPHQHFQIISMYYNINYHCLSFFHLFVYFHLSGCLFLVKLQVKSLTKKMLQRCQKITSEDEAKQIIGV